MKLLLYCNKAKPYLYRCFKLWRMYNGKIVAECDYEIEKIKCDLLDTFHKKYDYKTKTLDMKTLLNESGMDDKELADYLDIGDGYAIHIKNLHIFDEPKELREFKENYHIYDKFYDEPWAWHWVDKAPKNMMYVYDRDEKKILISIRPEWLCEILNGEKTIEVRKKVLKEML